MKENGKIIKNMEKDFLIGEMEINIQENGKIIKNMEMEFKH